MTDRDRDFADAARVVDESVVMRIVVGLSDFVGRAFQARRMATLKGSPHIMVTIVVACATHAVLLQWMPDRIAPAKPLAYLMVVAFGAFATVAGFITTRSRATATADSSAGTANTRKS
jgi:hypothetical protein